MNRINASCSHRPDTTHKEQIWIILALTAPVFSITELRAAEPQASVWMNCPESGEHEAPAEYRTTRHESLVRTHIHIMPKHDEQDWIYANLANSLV